MKLELVTVEISLEAVEGSIRDAVERSLQAHGEPLRWAITSVEGDRSIALVEAVVVIESPFPIGPVVEV